ncbi:MAG TPA: ABC transporter ATP-binding protein [Jatrophihabitantaceae bacterium]|jgi:oligopeptide/dipeptide ABC transporter ATP-binding protein
MSQPLLEVRDLAVQFKTLDGLVHAVDGVSFTVAKGEILGVVGESGSGKSVSVMSMLGLVPQPPGRIAGGSVLFEGTDLLRASKRRMRQIRGEQIGMIFQDPMTALNPVMRIGKQIAEAIRTHHRRTSGDAAMARAIDLLRLVGVPQPEARVQQYPHQFSGGMRQRAMIAMAIANDPTLLIADEPTTALDVTIQAQVLDMLRRAQAETGAATIFITHDLGVVAELAERVIVMYAGRVMESGAVRTIFASPRHPYTVGLLKSLPSLKHESQTLTPIPGNPPNLLQPIPGCPFQPRCDIGRDREICATTRPPLAEVAPGHTSACHFSDELAGTSPATTGAGATV